VKNKTTETTKAVTPAKRGLNVLLTTVAAVLATTVSILPQARANAASASVPKEATFRLPDILRIRELRKRDPLAPIVRIVSPLADSSVAPGESRTSGPSPNGTAFALNLEIVTRDKIALRAKEATLAPPVFGIRHVPELEAGTNNPDFPGLFVFFDTPLITPDGTVFPQFHNFASAFNVLGTDDTPGVGTTIWAGWHVLESIPDDVTDFKLIVVVVDDKGRIGFDEINLKVNRSRASGQALTPSVETFPGAAREFRAVLNGESERPTPVNTPGSGAGSVSFDPQTGVAIANLSFHELLGPQTIAHIHGPAALDAAAGVVFDIDTAATPPIASPGAFTVPLAIDPINLSRLQNGLLYFNVHSTVFGNGEIRGQILPVTSDPLGLGPEVSMIAPRVPTAIALGTQDNTLRATNGALFFIQVSVLDRDRVGVAVNETGIRAGSTLPFGLIFDPTQIPNAANGTPSGPNRNFPGLTVTFDVPLRQANGNVVPAGVNLAPLFDVAGSDIDASGAVRTTVDWVVGAALLAPAGKQNVTITAMVTDNAGRTGLAKSVLSISPVVSGSDLSADPNGPDGGDKLDDN
jgi:hypothetical protein